MRSGVAAFFVALWLGVQPVAANDLPVTGNRAAEEALILERGARTRDPSSKAAARLYSIIAKQWTWRSGPLKVCFWNGTPSLRTKVAAIADELVVGLPVRFDWNIASDCPGLTDPQAPWLKYDIRASLRPSGAVMGSGDDARAFFGLIGSRASRDRPTTVNLPFASGDAPAELRYRVLHEFCHALGCLHEHHRANCEDQFNSEAIKAQYGLTDAQYALNFAAIPEGGAYGPLAASRFDVDSVMLYRLSRAMFRAGTTPTCLRDPPAEKLSPGDTAGLQRAYASANDATRLSDFPAFVERYSRSAALKRKLSLGYRAVFVGYARETINPGLMEALSIAADADAAIDEELAASFEIDDVDRLEAEAALRLLGAGNPSSER